VMSASSVTTAATVPEATEAGIEPVSRAFERRSAAALPGGGEGSSRTDRPTPLAHSISFSLMGGGDRRDYSARGTSLPDGTLLDLRPETPADEIGTAFAAEEGNSALEKGPPACKHRGTEREARSLPLRKRWASGSAGRGGRVGREGAGTARPGRSARRARIPGERRRTRLAGPPGPRGGFDPSNMPRSCSGTIPRTTTSRPRGVADSPGRG
jgi:hypothetical protein